MADVSMMNSSDFVISSSWNSECETRSLRNTLTLSAPGKSVNLDDMVQLSTCVRLVQDSGSADPCSITIKLPNARDVISQVVVVSEARIVELFGGCDEYLSTSVGEYIDDFEDCSVYLATLNVKPPSRELLFKLQKTRHTDKLWVYGINLQLVPASQTPHALSSINFQSVNEMLKESKIPLSENAEKAKKFLQAYSGTLNNVQSTFKSKPPNPQVLMKMLEAGYLNPISETGKHMTKCLSNLVPFLSRESAESNTRVIPECDISQTARVISEDSQLLKDYIDHRFTQLELKIDRLEQIVKESEKRQNDRLDLIISFLNKAST